jgi:HEAT repeat protein
MSHNDLGREITELAPRLADGDVEVARAAKRAMWHCVRQAGRPDAGDERQFVVAALISLLQGSQPAAVYREVLWMLSEIGSAESVGPIAAMLSNKTAREDARMALERIPGDESVLALELALESAPADFRTNVAQSLRARGQEVPGLPCQKLKPTKQTEVSPV